MKTIKYFRTRQWGQEREYVHPENSDDGKIINQLTGKLTIDSATRELIRDLSGGQITFQEVIVPKIS